MRFTVFIVMAFLTATVDIPMAAATSEVAFHDIDLKDGSIIRSYNTGGRAVPPEHQFQMSRDGGKTWGPVPDGTWMMEIGDTISFRNGIPTNPNVPPPADAESQTYPKEWAVKGGGVVYIQRDRVFVPGKKGRVPAPDGSYELEDGVRFTVKNGEMTDYRLPANHPSATSVESAPSVGGGDRIGGWFDLKDGGKIRVLGTSETVLLKDKDGNDVPMDDGRYVLENGETWVVKGGLLADRIIP